MFRMEKRDIRALLSDKSAEESLVICLLEKVSNLQGTVVSIEKRAEHFYLVRDGREYLITTIEAGKELAERFAGDAEALWLVDEKIEETKENPACRYKISLRIFEGGMRISPPKEIFISAQRLNWIFPQLHIAGSFPTNEDKLKCLHDLFFYDTVCFLCYSIKRGKGKLYLIGQGQKILELERNINVWNIVALYKPGELEGFFPSAQNIVVCHHDIKFVLSEKYVAAVGPDSDPSEEAFLDFLDKYEEFEKEVLRTRQEESGYLEFKDVLVEEEKQIKFLISDIKSNRLEEFSKGACVEILKPPADNSEQNQIQQNMFVGRIVSFNVAEKELLVDYEDFEERAREFLDKKITRGQIGISWIGDTSIHERRERALNRFRSQSKTPLKDVLCFHGTGLEPRALPNPITQLLQSRFPDKTFNKAQTAAIKAAISTEDIAVIWGPPGTGKTTVIKAIIERFFEYQRNSGMVTKNTEKPVLITSYQNEAVDNIIVSRGIEIPAYRIGKSTNNLFEDWQQAIKTQMEQKMGINPQYKPWIDKLDYANQLPFDEKINLLTELTQSEVFKQFPQELQYQVRQLIEKAPDRARCVLFAQRLSPNAYADDGKARLDDLLRLLVSKKIIPSEDFLSEFVPMLDTSVEISNVQQLQDRFLKWLLTELPLQLQAGDENAFDQYRYVVQHLLIDLVTPDKEKQADTYLEHIRRILWKTATSDSKLAMIQYDFISQIGNIEFAKALINTYTNTIAGTCQKVGQKNNNKQEALPSRYQMVIVDETSRANMLDLLIPLSMGEKVILVGDFLQLPPLIDEEVQKGLRESKYKNFIDKTFFQQLYEFLKEKAPEKCVALTAQRRMHPDIGDFVGEQFYKPKGLPLSSEEVNVQEKMHGLNLYNGQAVAWENVPHEAGSETTQGSLEDLQAEQTSATDPEGVPQKRSLWRAAEIEKIRLLVDSVREQNPTKKIGIITFYKKQADELKKEFKEFEGLDTLKIGTVDAFQGKEFDIVFLSCVRSNKQRKVGFLNLERLCVAFTRAKQLMVVVGDKDTLCQSQAKPQTVPYIFQQFFDLCQSKGSVHE